MINTPVSNIAAESQTIIHLNGVTKHYDSAAGQVPVLRGLDLTVPAGKTVVLKGVSGSGKSTLLHILGAIEKASSGIVQVAGVQLNQLNHHAQTQLRAQHIGFVFQFFHLLPTLTAYENVVAALEPLGGKRTQYTQSVEHALHAVGLADLMHHYPSQLSGGQQQRIAIARALAKKPSLLLADEPTGALDHGTARQVLDCLKTMQQETHCAMVIATHDPLVCEYADYVYVLEGGKLVLLEKQ